MSTRHSENVTHVIHKFTLEGMDEQLVAMPLCSRLLHVGEQGGRMCVWATVEPDGPFGRRRFEIVGTGHTVPDAVYVGTVQMGALVWHLFDYGFERV